MNTYHTIMNIYPFHRILSIFHYSHQRKSPFPGKTGFIPPEKAIPEGTGKRTTRQHPGCPPAIPSMQPRSSCKHGKNIPDGKDEGKCG